MDRYGSPDIPVERSCDSIAPRMHHTSWMMCWHDVDVVAMNNHNRPSKHSLSLSLSLSLTHSLTLSKKKSLMNESGQK